MAEFQDDTNANAAGPVRADSDDDGVDVVLEDDDDNDFNDEPSSPEEIVAMTDEQKLRMDSALADAFTQVEKSITIGTLNKISQVFFLGYRQLL